MLSGTVECEDLDEDQRAVAIAAKKAFRGGGWPWDRAFMLASAYLAVTGGVPTLSCAPSPAEQWPIWVALDKHTPEGKQAIADAAKAAGIPVQHALWSSFYFESALNNAADPSVWWAREIKWRLARLGLRYSEAQQLWSHLRPLVAEKLRTPAMELQAHLASGAAPEQTSLI